MLEIMEMLNTCNKLSINSNAFKKSFDALNNIMCEIERYQECLTDEINRLKEEGLTEDEESKLCVALIRMRNKNIIKKCDLI